MRAVACIFIHKFWGGNNSWRSTGPIIIHIGIQVVLPKLRWSFHIDPTNYVVWTWWPMGRSSIVSHFLLIMDKRASGYFYSCIGTLLRWICHYILCAVKSQCKILQGVDKVQLYLGGRWGPKVPLCKILEISKSLWPNYMHTFKCQLWTLELFMDLGDR